MLEYVVHPLVKDGVVEKRVYQDSITDTCLKGNTLVILPTGLGKTMIAALAAAERLHAYPGGKCFILAPTKPLVLQHYETFKSVLKLDEDDFSVITGEKKPSERASIRSRMFFLTPQVLENDIITGRTNFKDVVLIVVDEAHRAVGNYSYVFIAKQYMKNSEHPLVLGLTASPGSSQQRVEEVKRNLSIEFVEARTDSSLDVKPYIKPTEVEWVGVKLTPLFEKIKGNLESFIKERLRGIRNAGFLEKSVHPTITYKIFSEVAGRLREEMAKYPKPPQDLRRLLVDLLSVKRASYALELLETQGLNALREYIQKLEAQTRRPGSSPSVRQMILDGRIQEAMSLSMVYGGKGLEHPKFDKLCEVVGRCLSERARRVIVFTNYRETSKRLMGKLAELPSVSAVRLVGQADKPEDDGIPQQEQARILTSFRDGIYNVLVATQVAEEGIDVSTSDIVVFYDNVPSAIRFIQRRGRTGRRSPGKVVILVTKGTKDEAYYWIARRKERMMMEIIGGMQHVEGETRNGKQQHLEKFVAEETPQSSVASMKPSIYVDMRESNSDVVKQLISFDVSINLVTLEVGDYVLSEQIAVERKTVKDFVASIVDKRLFSQAQRLASTYEKPLFIVEGENLYTASGVSSQAIRGAILSLILDFKIPVLLTKDPVETALTLFSVARKEQTKRGPYISIRAEKKPLSLGEQQEYVVAGLPNVELTLARRLLATFGSVEKVFSATEEELKKVRGVGDVIAQKVRKVIVERYSKTSAEVNAEEEKQE